MITLIFILGVFLSGYWLLRGAGFKGYKIETFAVGFLISIGILTYIYYLVQRITNQANPQTFWATFFAFFAAAFLINGFSKVKQKFISERKDIFAVIVWILIFTLWLIPVIYTKFTPVWNSDAIHLYDYRALVMYHTQTFSSIEIVPAWHNYPLYTTNLLLFGRFINFGNPGPLFPFIYLMFTIVFYCVVRRSQGPKTSSIATLLMFFTPLTYWQTRDVGLTNMTYTVYLSSAIFYLIEGIMAKKNNTPFIFASSILLYIAIWNRIVEPLWIAPICLLLFYIIKNRKWHWSPFVILFFLIRTSWTRYVGSQIINLTASTYGIIEIATSPENTYIPALNAIKDTFPYIYKSLTPVLQAFLGFILLSPFFKLSKRQAIYILAISYMILLLYLGLIYYAVHVPGWDKSFDSLARLVSVFSPLFWMFIFQSDIWSKYEKVKA